MFWRWLRIISHPSFFILLFCQTLLLFHRLTSPSCTGELRHNTADLSSTTFLTQTHRQTLEPTHLIKHAAFPGFYLRRCAVCPLWLFPFVFCLWREGEFLPPGQLECHKKFTGRLHAPDHSTCIIQRRLVVSFWSISALCTRPSTQFQPRQFLQPGSLAWQALVEESLSATPPHEHIHAHTRALPSPDPDYTPQAVTSPPPPPSPAFLILTCYSLLLKLEVKESTVGSATSWKASSTPPDPPLSSLWNSLSFPHNFCWLTKPHSHNVLSPFIPFPSARHYYFWIFFSIPILSPV